MTRCSAPREISVSEETPEKVEETSKSEKKEIVTRKISNPTSCKTADDCKKRGTCTCEKECDEPEAGVSGEKYDVFLGGSCGTTVWRRQSVIPFLKKRFISYYDPQRSVWSENMIYEESIAKENSSLFLFVIDPATVNATSFLEISYFAARKPPKLVVVFLGKTEWAEKAHPDDLPDRNRTCQLLDRILIAHKVPMLYNIPDALDFIEEEMLGRKKLSEAMTESSSRIPYLSMRLRQATRCAKSQLNETATRIRTGAKKATVAGITDAFVLTLCALLLPSIPLHAVFFALILINIAALVVTNKLVARRRSQKIVDSSAINYKSTSIPRSAAKNSPNGESKADGVTRRRSKNMFEQLVKDDGSNSFVVPRAPIQKRDVRFKVDSLAIEMCTSCLEESEWIRTLAAPLLDGANTPYSSGLSSKTLAAELKMSCLKAWQYHHKKFFYYIPNTQTFLSGMVEIAYILGHSEWEATICVPHDSQYLEIAEEELDDEKENEKAARRRRNDCYQIAFCYLRDMAKRRQCKVFTELDGALKSLVDETIKGI